MSKLSEEQIAEIIKLYQEGETPKAIGEKFGIYNNSVTRILRKRGIERNQCVQYSKEFTDSIIEKYKSGLSSSKIGEELGIHDSSICKILKRNNIEKNPKKKKKI